MDNQLFRQKSIDRISSPEQLHDYMRVTSPRLWMILSVIIALVVGLIVFSTLATMESTLQVTFEVDRYEFVNELEQTTDAMAVTMEIPMEYKDTITVGQEVRLANNRKGTVDFIYLDKESLIASIAMDTDEKLPEGNYPGEIVLDKKTPIDFLLN